MIFVDTSFFVALNATRDANHEQAVKLFQAYADQNLLTTNHVVGETWTFMRRRYGHTAAARTVDRVQRSPRIRVEHVESTLESDAWHLLARETDREISFVDATSFVVMRTSRTREVLSFDGDFSAAGFVELRV